MLKRYGDKALEESAARAEELASADDHDGADPPCYDFRLKDLRSFPLVRVSCHACAHKAIVANATLLQGRPGYTRLISLERQLRCRKCGAKGRASLEVTFRPRD